MPTDAQLSRALRTAVDEKFAEDPGDVRPKAVRTIAEKLLGLEAGYFLETDDWKERSKEILQDRFEQLTSSDPPQSKTKKRKSSEVVDEEKQDVSPPKKSKRKSDSSQGIIQGKGAAKPKQKKRLEKSLSALVVKEDDSAKESEEEEEEVTSPAQTGTHENVGEKFIDAPTSHKPHGESLDDSDLSSLIDEPPIPIRKKNKKVSDEPAEKPVKSRSTSKKAAESGSSSQDAELKELQSQLGQCGIRKIWAMHLKKFDGHKEKVVELKRMLKEVGMQGRFSKEKARQIKEERELKADIEAIQEGDQKWGKAEEDHPRRRAVANRVVDFDDEESE